MKRILTEKEKERLRNIKSKTQDDLITISSRFSVWRDKDQWFLYDFHGTRENRQGQLRKPPQPTFHPKLEQMINEMTERTCREAEDMTEIILKMINLRADLKGAMERYLEPLGITPADAAMNAAEKLKMADVVDLDDETLARVAPQD